MYQALAEISQPSAVATANGGPQYGLWYGKNSVSTWTRWTSRLLCLGSWCDNQSRAGGPSLWNLANGGVMNDTSLPRMMPVAKWSEPQSESTRVLSGSTTDKMTNMMLGTFSNGTGSTLRLMAIPGRENRYDRDQALTRTSPGDQWRMHARCGHQSMAWFPNDR